MNIIVFESSGLDQKKIAVPAHEIWIKDGQRWRGQDLVDERGWSCLTIWHGRRGIDCYTLHPRETVQRAIVYFTALQEADKKQSLPSLILPNGGGARPGADTPKVTGRILDLTTTPISIEEMLEKPGEPGNITTRRVELFFTPEPGRPAISQVASGAVVGSKATI